jgi:hypothetical protein
VVVMREGGHVSCFGPAPRRLLEPSIFPRWHDTKR